MVKVLVLVCAAVMMISMTKADDPKGINIEDILGARLVPSPLFAFEIEALKEREQAKKTGKPAPKEQ